MARFFRPSKVPRETPLAFTILDIANGLTTGGAAVACRVAERARGVFVAAWPIAERK